MSVMRQVLLCGILFGVALAGCRDAEVRLTDEEEKLVERLVEGARGEALTYPISAGALQAFIIFETSPEMGGFTSSTTATRDFEQSLRTELTLLGDYFRGSGYEISYQLVGMEAEPSSNLEPPPNPFVEDPLVRFSQELRREGGSPIGEGASRGVQIRRDLTQHLDLRPGLQTAKVMVTDAGLRGCEGEEPRAKPFFEYLGEKIGGLLATGGGVLVRARRFPFDGHLCVGGGEIEYSSGQSSLEVSNYVSDRGRPLYNVVVGSSSEIIELEKRLSEEDSRWRNLLFEPLVDDCPIELKSSGLSMAN